jgi:hypothetical protein
MDHFAGLDVSVILRRALHRLPQLLQRSLPAQPAELLARGARRHQRQRGGSTTLTAPGPGA